MARMILGVFGNDRDAEVAVGELKDFGIASKDISIVMRDSENKVHLQSSGANVFEGAAGGAATGGILGGLAGLLIGIGAIAIPGIGALLIGGPLAIALGLTGAAATTVSGAVTGALAGGLVGGLVGLGVPEEDAKFYEESVKKGAVLIAVPVDNLNESETREILEANHADQIRTISYNPSTAASDETRLEDEGVYRPAYFEEIRRRHDH